MARVLLSAAHTSIAPGEVYGDLREFDLTRKILNYAVKHLEKEKIEFKAVPADLQLINRIDWINNTGYKEEDGDIFVEIHVNDGGKRGIETWYSGKDDAENNSEVFAKALHEELCNLTKYDSQGVKSETEHELKSLLILNQTNPIAVATELLYIDNADDIKILKDEAKLDELAKNLVLAIKKYLDSKPKIFPKKQTSNNLFGGTPGLGGGGLFGDNDDDFGDDFSSPLGGIGGAPKPSSNANITMDREQRKKMIEDTYKELLDKEAKQSDMNYYLNTGISEDELIKKIVKSQDHKDLVKDAKDAKELRESSKKSEAELIELRSKINDLNKMHHNFNVLLQHKNMIIKNMQNELIRNNIIKPGQYFEPNRIQQNPNPSGPNAPRQLI